MRWISGINEIFIVCKYSISHCYLRHFLMELLRSRLLGAKVNYTNAYSLRKVNLQVRLY